jgi:hypothetical protein
LSIIEYKNDVSENNNITIKNYDTRNGF